ncbi:hypothetical protein V8G54_034999 [Vigna mungo]|uniref:Uncharacterized protein n=1 Tax=Vigna mungo TaxID=3915 RepID=A0AAQ3RF80_VIGMU
MVMGILPLIKVLCVVDSNEKAAMGFIYEEMDIAKEKIQSYDLNPMLHYNTKFKIDYEVRRGMHDCLDRLVGDIYEISKIDAQIESFKSKFGFFGSSIAQHAFKPKSHHNGGNIFIQFECNWSSVERVHTKKRNHLQKKTMNNVVFVMAYSRLKKHLKLEKMKMLVKLVLLHLWMIWKFLQLLMMEGHGGEDINENEDHVEKDDDYPKLDMKDFLG